MCYTLLQDQALRKKCPIILNAVMAHHTPTLGTCNGISVIVTNKCTQLSLDPQ